MLILPIKSNWLGRIRSREKLDEYREIKPYWTKRIVRWLGYSDKDTEAVIELLRRKGTTSARKVILKNGYSSNAPTEEVMCTLSIGTGKTEWGAEEGVEYYRFHIEEIISKITCVDCRHRTDVDDSGDCYCKNKCSPYYKEPLSQQQRCEFAEE